MPARKRSKIYTVGEINTLVKEVLEDAFAERLIVRGEISGYKRHSSGHCYFSLKDETGVLPCVMWSSSFLRVKFRPEDGMAVLATGRIGVYTVGGKYQLYVEKLDPEGTGALQLAFEQMVKKLRAEGLFDEIHKKPIPQYPQRIGMLTSESGAAVHDIADSIFNRWACVRLFLYPVPVQGEGAAEKIAAAIRDVNRRNERLSLDVLIVGRGGGSLEDLWAFNEEVLARAIFASRIPVISAVGHEVDVTIADLVADQRASTPTKAGMVAVPGMREVLGELSNVARTLAADVRARLVLSAQVLQTVQASAAFRNPLLTVRERDQQVDELAVSLDVSIRESLRAALERLRGFREQIVRIEPRRHLANVGLDLSGLRSRVANGMADVLARSKIELTAHENRLAALNPRSVLERGYSITTNKRTGAPVRRLADIDVGDDLITELAREDRIESRVTGKSPKP